MKHSRLTIRYLWKSRDGTTIPLRTVSGWLSDDFFSHELGIGDPASSIGDAFRDGEGQLRVVEWVSGGSVVGNYFDIGTSRAQTYSHEPYRAVIEVPPRDFMTEVASRASIGEYGKHL